MDPIYKLSPGDKLNGWLTDEVNDFISKSLQLQRSFGRYRRWLARANRDDELYAITVGLAVGAATTALCALYGYIGLVGLS